MGPPIRELVIDTRRKWSHMDVRFTVYTYIYIYIYNGIEFVYFVRVSLVYGKTQCCCSHFMKKEEKVIHGGGVNHTYVYIHVYIYIYMCIHIPGLKECPA